MSCPSVFCELPSLYFPEIQYALHYFQEQLHILFMGSSKCDLVPRTLSAYSSCMLEILVCILYSKRILDNCLNILPGFCSSNLMSINILPFLTRCLLCYNQAVLYASISCRIKVPRDGTNSSVSNYLYALSQMDRELCKWTWNEETYSDFLGLMTLLSHTASNARSLVDVAGLQFSRGSCINLNNATAGREIFARFESVET